MLNNNRSWLGVYPTPGTVNPISMRLRTKLFASHVCGADGRGKKGEGEMKRGTTSSALLQLVRFFVGVYFWNTLRLLYNCELTETPTETLTAKPTATLTVTAL